MRALLLGLIVLIGLSWFVWGIVDVSMFAFNPRHTWNLWDWAGIAPWGIGFLALFLVWCKVIGDMIIEDWNK